MNSIEDIVKKLRESRLTSLKESKSKTMEFTTDTEAYEWAEENDYQVDKIQNGTGSKSCIAWMSKIDESENPNQYSKKFKVGDKVRYKHPGGKLSTEIATITGYDSDGFYMYTWDDGEEGHGSSDFNFSLVRK